MKTAKPIKNILFDLGGVIYDIEPAHTQKAIERLLNTDAAQDMFTKSFQMDFVSDYEIGKISTQRFVEEIRNAYQLTDADAAIEDAWNALLIGVIPGRVDFLNKLKQKYPLALLSNTNELHLAYIWDDCVPVFDTMQQCFFSCKIGMRKPNADIFEYTLHQMGWNAEETLFIEDSPPNIAGAKAIGMPVFEIHSLADFQRFESWILSQNEL